MRAQVPPVIMATCRMCGPADLRPGDHQRGYHQRVEGDRGLDAGHRRADIGGHLADRDIHDRPVQRHQKLACGQDQQTNPLPAAASPAVTAATAFSSGIAPAAPSACIFAKTSRPPPHDRTASRPPIGTASIVHKGSRHHPGRMTATPAKGANGLCLEPARHDVSRAGDKAIAGVLGVGEWRCSSRIGDSGPRPAAGGAAEHLGQPAFRQRIPGLHAEPVRGHRRVIASAGIQHLIGMLPAGEDGRLPGGLTRGPPRRA